MLHTKRTIVIAVATTALAAGIIGGVVVAHAQTGSTNTAGNTIMARVAAILGIDQTKLQDAFIQAKKDQQTQNLDNHLQNLVTQGKITQSQADQYKQWWSSKPDVPVGVPGGGPMMRPGMRGGFPRFHQSPAATPTPSAS